MSDSDDSSVKPDVCDIVKKPLPTTAHSSGAKIVEAGGYSNVYLNHQGSAVSANKVLDGAMENLERLLNQNVACDVACGLVNILTAKSTSTVGESTLEYHWKYNCMHEVAGRMVYGKLVNGVVVPVKLVKGVPERDDPPPPTWDAFWDPKMVGATLPLSTANGAKLYEASNKSAVGIEGRGTVEDATVRSSHETVLEEYSKQVSARMAQESLTPQQEMVRAVDNVMKGATNASPQDNDGTTAPLQLPSAILNFDFPEALEDIRRKLCPLAPRIQVVPYKIVTYSEGDYFLPHVDSMDHNAMQFGSLALQLPFTYKDEEMAKGTHAGDEPPTSVASGELVFYMGRHLDGDRHHIPDQYTEKKCNYRNKRWTSYDKPRGDSEQLRMRVDLTSTMAAVKVDNEQVSAWVAEKSGQEASSTNTAALSGAGVEFQVQPLKFAAWQGDIPHEVTRITSVYRAVVLYRLIKVFDNSDDSKPTDPIPFLTQESREALSAFAGEGVVTTTPVDLAIMNDSPAGGGVIHDAIAKAVHYLSPPKDNDSLETVWGRFEAQTAALKSYRGISYSSLISPAVRGTIHGAVAKAVSNFLPPNSPPIPITLEGTRLLQYVVDTLQTTPEETDLECGPVTHLGFILRHQYAPAVQRIIHELQSPTSPHAQALPYGVKRRLIIALLKGADAVVYTLLTEVGEVSIHAAHQHRTDYPSSPFRITSSPRCDCATFGRWVQKIYPAPVVLASDKANDSDEGKIEKCIELYNDEAAEQAEAMYPSFVDCAWITMGLGKLVGGGQSYGNADCGSDWWYRNSVMIYNPQKTSPIFWRHRLLLLALRKNTSTPCSSDEVEPIIKILRTLLACPDVFGHVAAFL